MFNNWAACSVNIDASRIQIPIASIGIYLVLAHGIFTTSYLLNVNVESCPSCLDPLRSLQNTLEYPGWVRMREGGRSLRRVRN